MSDYFRPAQRNKALAFFYLAIPVGAAVGFTLGGALATAFGWRWAFASPSAVVPSTTFLMRLKRLFLPVSRVSLLMDTLSRRRWAAKV
jgi:MFS family permease